MGRGGFGVSWQCKGLMGGGGGGGGGGGVGHLVFCLLPDYILASVDENHCCTRRGEVCFLILNLMWDYL